jgi:hypothetical protein
MLKQERCKGDREIRVAVVGFLVSFMDSLIIFFHSGGENSTIQNANYLYCRIVSKEKESGNYLDITPFEISFYF